VSFIINVSVCTSNYTVSQKTFARIITPYLGLILIHFLHFTALHVLHATRSNHEKAVCPSVRLSLKGVICDKKKESCVHLLPHERTFILVWKQEEWLVGGDPFYLKFWVKVTPLKQKLQFLIDIRS